MVQEIRKVEYECEVCKEVYASKTKATMCEKRPITQDKRVKIGDTVLITGGDGNGKKAKVTKVVVHMDEDMPERYWHTVALEAKLINSWGSRFLTFDQYKKV